MKKKQKLIIKSSYIQHTTYNVVQEYDNDLVDTLRLRQIGQHFTADTFKCIFLNKNLSISIDISRLFVS